jgi:uncharacterized protein YkwD
MLAGAGLGIGIDVIAQDAERVAPRAVVEAPAAPRAVVEAPVAPPAVAETVFELPVLAGSLPEAAAEEAGFAGDPGPGVLPLEFERAMGRFGVWAPPEPESVAPEAPAAAPVPKPAPVGGSAPAPAAPANAGGAPAAAPAVQPAAPAAPARPNFHVPAVSSGPPTALETQLFELINAERAKAGLAPYVWDAGLTKIARTRSQQLIDQGYFGHVDPFGYAMYVELLAYFGFTQYAWAGENLAMNNFPVDQTAATAMRGLMNSPTHRANLLAGDFSRIGVGQVTDAQGRHYFTMIFLG